MKSLTNYFLIFILLSSFTIFSCSSSNDCSFKELKNTNTTSIKSTEYTAGLKGVIKGNLTKLLADGEVEAKGGVKISDFINIAENVIYTPEFIERHNAIVQVLCSIEADLNHPKIPQEQISELFKDKKKKRDEYFALLIKKENKKDSLNIEPIHIPKPEQKPIIPKKVLTKLKLRVDNRYINKAVLIDDNLIEQRFFGISSKDNSIEIELLLSSGSHSLKLEGCKTNIRITAGENTPINYRCNS